MNSGNHERDLDRLWSSYRDACPDVEGSPNFLPNLWQRIEARETSSRFLGHFARVFVSAGAVLCLLMVALLSIPHSTSGPSLAYMETVDSDQSHELLAYADIDADGDFE